MNEWKVGDVVVCETPFIFNKKSIIRETQTTWVLDDGTKIKKGQRKPIGENGYGARLFYSLNEPEGKKIIENMKKARMVDMLKKYEWGKFNYETLNKIVTFLNGIEK